MPETLTETHVYRFDQMAVQVKDKVEPDEADVDRYVGLEHIDPESLKIRRWGEPSDVESSKILFKAGDIIFGKRRAYQRKLAVADFDGICSAHAMVLRPKTDVVLREFLPFFMQSDIFMNRAVRISVGGLSPTINWGDLAKEEFALPPLDKQRRIAEVLAIHHRVVDCVLTADNALRAVKRSLLDSEFPFDSSRQQCVPLANLLKTGVLDFQTGPFGTVLAAREYSETGWPIINPTDIRNGVVAHSNGPCVSDATASRLEKYRMQVADVLLARKGEIDKACIADISHEGWIVGSDCIRLRSEESALSALYLLYFLQSGRTGRMLASYAHGTVMPGLNEKMLARLELHLPSPEIQSGFVSRVVEIDSQLARLGDRINQMRGFGRALMMNLLSVTGGVQ